MSDFTRPEWDEIFIEMCFTLAKRSTCLRIQTSSIITKNNVIVSIGYNGSTPNSIHCNDYWFGEFNKTAGTTNATTTFPEYVLSDEFYKNHHEWSNVNELHGEMNAILQAGKNGISLENSTIYTIYSPCINCAKCIISAGIKKVIYNKLYKRDGRGIEFLKNNGIAVITCDNARANN